MAARALSKKLMPLVSRSAASLVGAARASATAGLADAASTQAARNFNTFPLARADATLRPGMPSIGINHLRTNRNRTFMSSVITKGQVPPDPQLAQITDLGRETGWLATGLFGFGLFSVSALRSERYSCSSCSKHCSRSSNMC